MVFGSGEPRRRSSAIRAAASARASSCARARRSSSRASVLLAAASEEPVEQATCMPCRMHAPSASKNQAHLQDVHDRLAGRARVLDCRAVSSEADDLLALAEAVASARPGRCCRSGSGSRRPVWTPRARPPTWSRMPTATPRRCSASRHPGRPARRRASWARRGRAVAAARASAGWSIRSTAPSTICSGCPAGRSASPARTRRACWSGSCTIRCRGETFTAVRGAGAA